VEKKVCHAKNLERKFGVPERKSFQGIGERNGGREVNAGNGKKKRAGEIKPQKDRRVKDQGA